LLMGGLSVGLAACSPSAPLRMGMHPWPGYESLALAQHFGWLPGNVLLSVGASASDSMEGLRSGRLDAAALTLDEVLALRCEGAELEVVLVFNESVGADQVVARTGLSLAGRNAPLRVAVERSAVGKVVFTRWQQHLKLPMEAFELIDLPPAEQLAAWESGAIDVGISYAPFSRQLVQRGGAVIYDSRSFPGLVLDVLAVRTDRTGWRDRAVLKALLEAHFKGRSHLRQNPEDAMRRIAVWRELDYREVLMGYAGINQPDEATNRRLMQDGDMVSTAIQTLEPLMREASLLSRPCQFNGLLNPGFIP